MIGRERECEIIQDNTDGSDFFIDSDLDRQKINRKLWDLNVAATEIQTEIQTEKVKQVSA